MVYKQLASSDSLLSKGGGGRQHRASATACKVRPFESSTFKGAVAPVRVIAAAATAPSAAVTLSPSAHSARRGGVHG
jgi:hypothetical protein